MFRLNIIDVNGFLSFRNASQIRRVLGQVSIFLFFLNAYRAVYLRFPLNCGDDRVQKYKKQLFHISNTFTICIIYALRYLITADKILLFEKYAASDSTVINFDLTFEQNIYNTR